MAQTSVFFAIGIISYSRASRVTRTVDQLLSLLQQGDIPIFLSTDIPLPSKTSVPKLSIKSLVQRCDLIITIGGDGNFLSAARHLHDSSAALLGINCGRLGFLADLNPNDIEMVLPQILRGFFTVENRSLLIAENGQSSWSENAFNDVVLRNVKGQMIEFVIYIDQHFVARQRADGLIVATPAGSTAYALSLGGPLLHPQIRALVLVPIAAHHLSSRPVVVSDESTITVELCDPAQLWCDGVSGRACSIGEKIVLQRSSHSIRVIHPLGYDYYEVCREKLGWNSGMERT